MLVLDGRKKSGTATEEIKVKKNYKKNLSKKKKLMSL